MGSPILLVLDDVWQGSESLVEKFKFQISDYKVLVTSRVAFPRFVTSCHLKPLGHDDAIKLFRHFSLPNDGSLLYKPDEKLVDEVLSLTYNMLELFIPVCFISLKPFTIRNMA